MECFATLFSLFFIFSSELNLLGMLIAAPFAYIIGLFLSFPAFLLVAVLFLALDIVKSFLISIYSLFNSKDKRSNLPSLEDLY